MYIKGGLLLWFIIFFNKKSVGSGFNMHANNECPLSLDEELHTLLENKKKMNSLFKIQR